MEYIITHEMAHSFDFTNGILSNTKGENGYEKIFEISREQCMEITGIHDPSNIKNFITDYALEKTIEDKNPDYPYAEDFAESVWILLSDQRKIHENFPAKEKYLCELLNIPIYKSKRD